MSAIVTAARHCWQVNSYRSRVTAGTLLGSPPSIPRAPTKHADTIFLSLHAQLSENENRRGEISLRHKCFHSTVDLILPRQMFNTYCHLNITHMIEPRKKHSLILTRKIPIFRVYLYIYVVVFYLLSPLSIVCHPLLLISRLLLLQLRQLCVVVYWLRRSWTSKIRHK